MLGDFIIEGSSQARIIADSTYGGSRLTTLEVEIPRPYLAEFNTHCVFARNSASSRAIPVSKRLIDVYERPYVPNSFGLNKSGMQSAEELSTEENILAQENWLFGRDMALIQALALAGGKDGIMSSSKDKEAAEQICDLIAGLASDHGVKRFLGQKSRGAHKQHVNRVLEPYAFHTIIVTSTFWRNFYALRNSQMAQPEAQDFGIAMALAMMSSVPRELNPGEWHLPFIMDADIAEVPEPRRNENLAMASAAKCGRVSYLTHDGLRSIGADLQMSGGLKSHGHMSPFEHQARPREKGDPVGSNGKFCSVWTQHRKLLDYEWDFSKLINHDDLIMGCRGDVELADFILSLPH
jgi:hypothetical protein